MSVETPGVRAHGRLLDVQGTRVLLADALGQRWFEVIDAAGLTPGDWLVLGVETSQSPSTLPPQSEAPGIARVLERHAGLLRSGGDRSRFERVGPCLVRMAQARRAIRQHFDGRGFLEVQTPIRVAAPDPSVYIAPLETAQGWLITSPEFHMKRLLVGGLTRIYQFAPCTREGECGKWHQPEFTLLEWYRAFESMDSVMYDTEALVKFLAHEFCVGPTLRHGQLSVRLDVPFEHLTVRDAFRRFAGIEDASELAQDDEDRYFELFVDVVEPALAKFDRPVFVTEYPRSQAALAQRCAHDPSVAERFELYLGGVELCNGYGELTDADEQLARFEQDLLVRQQRGLKPLPLDHQFIAALREGMPPAAGNALGFERLMALVLGVPLSEVITFPAS